jgi:hypothetical protein
MEFPQIIKKGLLDFRALFGRFVERFSKSKTDEAGHVHRESRDKYGASAAQDTQEVFGDVQSKRRSLKPGATDSDLSDVLDDALKGKASTQDSGLYAQKRPKT